MIFVKTNLPKFGLFKKEKTIHLQSSMPNGVIGNTLKSDLRDSWFESLLGNNIKALDNIESFFYKQTLTPYYFTY